MPEETVGVADKAGCDCPPCRKAQGLPHEVRSGLIHDYSSMPRSGWRARYTAAETRDGLRPPTFGIELETSVPFRRWTDLPNRPFVTYLGYDATPEEIAEHAAQRALRAEWQTRNDAHRDRQRRRMDASGDMTAEEAVSMAAPRGLWHAKHDGSVSGPEFASQPGSLAYWRSQRGHLAGMFRSLLHGGMRSHDGDTCGFHVNIGTDAFDSPSGYSDPNHLERFATLVAVNQRWSIRMAQRTHESANWARFDGLNTPEKRAQWARSVARNGYAHDDHSAVLNASHSGRVEFRLPRGTLRVDRFYAKVEWTASMVEYTRDPANLPRPSDYMRWVEASGEYPEVTRMMRERFSAARFGEVT